MKILHYKWLALTRSDVTKAFQKLNIDFDEIINWNAHDNKSLNDEELCENLRGAIKKASYDAVFSINYMFNVARVCHEMSIPYIAWSYDSPMSLGDLRYFSYDTTHVFVFDRQDYLLLRNRIFAEHVYHLPLAVDTDRLDRIYCSSADRRKYGAQVSFVGKLYEDYSREALSFLSDYDKGYLNAVKDAQFVTYGHDIMSKALTEDFMKRISTPEFMKAMESTIFKERRDEIEYIPSRSLWMQTYRELTRKERILLLNLFATHYNTALFSYNQNELLKNVHMRDKVNYLTEMPKVFKSSNINLNISLRSILTGIPQRCLDIMGCGGFLLSNYQSELAEYFTDGEDCAIYTGIEDAFEKGCFYMEHEDERRRVAKNGYLKCKEQFRYEDRIMTMLKAVGLKP